MHAGGTTPDTQQLAGSAQKQPLMAVAFALLLRSHGLLLHDSRGVAMRRCCSC